MTVFRFRHEPRFTTRQHRLRTYAFLFAFFSILAAHQAKGRRVIHAAKAAAATRQAEHRAGLSLTAWRSASGVEVAIVSSLQRPARVLVAVKELAGPWSPTRVTLEVPVGGVRLCLPRALGERVFLLDPGPLPPHHVVDGVLEPEEREPRVLGSAAVQTGAGLEVDAQGRFAWRPERRWLIAVSHDASVRLDGPEAAAVRVPSDPALDDALVAFRARPDLVWRQIGPRQPLRGRFAGRGVQELPMAVSVRLEGVPRATPLQLRLLPALARWAADERGVAPGP